jgi:MHS family shikimate/dehydroshikimate transporter-like MFS transporter
MATGVFSLVSLLPEPAFLAWGWRVPFLLSIAMLGVGLFIRLSVDETPDFERIRDTGTPQAVPVMDLVRNHRRNALLAIGARLAETVSGNMIKSFGLTYATVELGLHSATALAALMATSIVGLVATPIYGALGDRFGQRVVYMTGAAFAAVLAFPFFWVLDARTVLAVWLGFIVAYNLGPTLMLSVQPTFFTQLFDPEVRYTGLSVAYQVSAIIGGFTPLISIWLLKLLDGAPWLVASFIALMAALSFVCVGAARRLHALVPA